MSQYEKAIAELREMGSSKIDTIRNISKKFGISIAAAKREVHFSNAWSDTRDADEKLHDMVEAAARQSDE